MAICPAKDQGFYYLGKGETGSGEGSGATEWSGNSGILNLSKLKDDLCFLNLLCPKGSY